MVRDWRNGYNLLIDLRIEGEIRNKHDRGTRKRFVDVICEDLILEFKNSSSLLEWEGTRKKYIQECDYERNWW
ncbi:hypothetical protein RND71_036001 [Anisodus tanguticus]|uniref:Uncharacterized protein n=1 Tax=Anisodus tanguticus TaxID=243964 RepID=A0AAE1R631_9SOLA|nr:hypothetical protein RND71_036001 [Anisodus tanguticus]